VLVISSVLRLAETHRSYAKLVVLLLKWSCNCISLYTFSL